MTRVVHVIERMSPGGASRALRGLTEHVDGVEHRVLDLAQTPVRDERAAVLREADIVHAHFWNNPALCELLAGELPPMRLLVWVHVAGDRAPHLLTRQIVELADLTVASTPHTRGFPDIPPAIGWDHLGDLQPSPHSGFNVGYIGTVDFAKMDRAYVHMSARVAVPDVRFIVCGSGGGFASLAREAEDLGVRQRFDLRGFTRDVGGVLAELDVFGYPLCEDNYSGTEIVLQEAMYAGVPPVVMARGGAATTVDDRRTGLVAGDEDEYVAAIEWLYAHPEERRRLGTAARTHAVRTWSPDAVEERWHAVYEELLARPKRVPAWRRDGPLDAAAVSAPGAALFVESLGDEAEPFRASLLSDEHARVADAEQSIAASTPVVSAAILQYRAHHPDDPYLRLWAGLVLGQQGRRALAAGEFAGAMKQGLDRAQPYLAEIHG